MQTEKPILSLEWHITDFCNYKCEYCCEKQYSKKKIRYGFANKKTQDSILKVLSDLPGSWQIKFAGGEPTTHPDFISVCKKIKESGHTLCLTTNFSMPFNKLKKFIDVCGDKLDFVSASLHLSQTDSDSFIKKALQFNQLKHPKTDFSITSVVTENNFKQLKRIKEILDQKKIRFEFHRLRTSKKSISYSSEIENYISDNLVKNTDKTEAKHFFGILCHTGELFFIIKPNGDVHRCFESQPGKYLGNMSEGTFKRFSKPKPCLSHKCVCMVPDNRNMIIFNSKKNPLKTKLYLYKNLYKNFISKKSNTNRGEKNNLS